MKNNNLVFEVRYFYNDYRYDTSIIIESDTHNKFAYKAANSEMRRVIRYDDSIAFVEIYAFVSGEYNNGRLVHTAFAYY